MLALFGLLIVTGFMVLIMTKKAPPFTSLVLVPLLIWYDNRYHEPIWLLCSRYS